MLVFITSNSGYYYLLPIKAEIDISTESSIAIAILGASQICKSMIAIGIYLRV
ncbi:MULTISPECIES: hypothetical protein [Spirulina sp. CCY15215]|uniref:hypothetical protein n=1 Tax=Spirulina sp. CCY15215 TaxID=2767591 RepID=UPI00195262FB|nr:hypothetical protein [Spirulina major]